MNTTAMLPRRYVDVANAATYAGVSTKTIQRWLERGELTGFRPAGLGKALIDMHQLDALIRDSSTGNRRLDNASDKR